MKLNAAAIFSRIIEGVIARPKTFVFVSVILTVLAVLTIALKFDIKSDLKALMPQDAQVVQDMYTISERMGSITTLTVYLKIPELKALSPEARDTDEYRECLATLGDPEDEHILREKPPVGENWCDNPLMLFARRFVGIVRGFDSVGNVGFHNDKTFFEKNILLYASNDELEEAYRQIDESLTEARRQKGEYEACLIVAESDEEEAECEELRPGVAKQVQGEGSGDGDSDGTEGFKEQLVEKYKASELSTVREFPFYPLEDNAWMVALNIRFKKSTTGLKEVKAEVARIDEALAKVDMNAYDPRIVVEYGGGLNDMKSEYNAIIVDIVRSISITIFSIFALIAIFFRSWRAPFRIFGPLLMSTIWSLAIAFLAIGFLNLITAFIFAILVGLGIQAMSKAFTSFLLLKADPPFLRAQRLSQKIHILPLILSSIIPLAQRMCK